MKQIVMSALFAAALSVGLAAHSGGTMTTGDGMGKAEKMSTQTTYTGCLEPGSAPGTFTLTHASRVDANEMKADANEMKNEAMSGHAMQRGTMESTTLKVASTSVGLTMHVGRKVSVTGAVSSRHMDSMHKESMHGNGMPENAMHESSMNNGESIFTIRTLKELAASCS